MVFLLLYFYYLKFSTTIYMMLDTIIKYFLNGIYLVTFLCTTELETLDYCHRLVLKL